MEPEPRRVGRPDFFEKCPGDEFERGWVCIDNTEAGGRLGRRESDRVP